MGKAFWFAFLLMLITEGQGYTVAANQQRYRIVNSGGRAVKIQTRVPEYNVQMLERSENKSKDSRRVVTQAGYKPPVVPKRDFSGDKYYTNSRLEKNPSLSVDYGDSQNNGNQSAFENAQLGNVYKQSEKIVYKRGENGRNVARNGVENKGESLSWKDEVGTEYFVEVGSYKEKRKAERFSKEVSRKTKIPLEPVFDGLEYIVSIGPLFSRDDAIVMRKELKDRGYANPKIVLAENKA